MTSSTPPVDYRAVARNKKGVAVALAVVGGLVVLGVVLSIGGRRVNPTPTSTNTSAVSCASSTAAIEASSTAPDGVDAAGTTISYSADHLLDSDKNTAWRAPGKAVGVTLTMTFTIPCTLTKIEIINGYAKTDPRDDTDRWAENRRVSSLKISTNQRTVTKKLSTKSRGWQTIELNDTAVSSIVFTVAGSAPSKSKRNYTALSEIHVS